MNKRKAIRYILTAMLLLGGFLAGKSYAALSGKVVLSAPATATKEDTLTVYVKTSNVQTGKGIVAMGAVLDYDKNSLTLKEVEGEGRWSAPSYNQDNGKLTSLRSKRMTSDENILKITFTVNKNAQTSTWVKINNLEISDGEEEKVIGGNTATITVQDKKEEKPPVDEDKNQEETPEGGNQGGGSSGTTTTTNNKKPNTTKPSTTKKPTNNSNTTQTTTTEDPEKTDTEETNTVVNEVAENTTENTAAGIQEEMANLMQSTKPTVEENKKDYKWLLFVILGIVVVLVIAIVGYEKRK